ncbi:Fe2+-dependent dioxygenase [Roseisalinus antarcticus]|uniref:PKHD-type hydroxylase n=1 Tax=Roseisalinus antarcticus TaxID=254357 RepID=A0A1Y5T0A8_9RHOB|nr:Fe2+-dependent dioxygenase [Roseisalinus antarcticus]SLN53011.1 PKHD-type hydroxylase [Roseisalinus antarcticus]
MILVIANVLDAHEVAALRAAAEKLDFVDGKTTAGRYARDVKQNLQASPSKALDGLFEKVSGALSANEVFQAGARPRGFARMLLSRYRSGMAYGLHVDDPIMQGQRTDLSFTLPLSDPAEYDGGGLVIDDGLEERVIRLAAGDAVVYPTSALHRVEPVTRGERMAFVGWVTSRVRDPARREVLYDLDVAAREVFETLGKTPAFDRLFKAKSNLYRIWADD